MIKSFLHKRKISLFGASLLLFVLFSPAICHNASAITTVPKSKYKIVATFPNSNYMTQGGIVTSKYYVYTDCGKTNAQQNGGKSHHCTDSSNAVLRIVDRNTCKQTDSTKITSGYLSGLYHEWGTNKISLFGTNKACMVINNGKASKGSGCKSATRVGVGISTGQGASALFNGYYYTVEGTTNQQHPIGVFRSKDKKKIGVWQLEEKLGEPEQISIDGNTGEVFIAYNKGHKTGSKTSEIFFVKIDASVFAKYTGINKTNNNPVICKGFGNPSGGSNGDNSGSNNGGDNSGSAQPEPSQPTPTPTASDREVECASILKHWCEKADGDAEQAIIEMIKFVINIMAAGVVILGAIGILICGFMIMSAKDNEAQLAKAKKRLFEIVIGVVIFVILGATISLLLPVSDTQVDEIINTSEE